MAAQAFRTCAAAKRVRVRSPCLGRTPTVGTDLSASCLCPGQLSVNYNGSLKESWGACRRMRLAWSPASRTTSIAADCLCFLADDTHATHLNNRVKKAGTMMVLEPDEHAGDHINCRSLSRICNGQACKTMASSDMQVLHGLSLHLPSYSFYSYIREAS